MKDPVISIIKSALVTVHFRILSKVAHNCSGQHNLPDAVDRRTVLRARKSALADDQGTTGRVPEGTCLAAWMGSGKPSESGVRGNIRPSGTTASPSGSGR